MAKEPGLKSFKGPGLPGTSGPGGSGQLTPFKIASSGSDSGIRFRNANFTPWVSDFGNFRTLLSIMQQPSTRTWTLEQDKAITTVGNSLLVSAAAGSGKTSVLAERCVHLLCRADPCCEVSDLLVVTFTEAAAAEMKGRIAVSLAKHHAGTPGENTARHLSLLDRASIGTLHGFCARVLRQNFHALGIDPDFRILDPDEAELLKLDVARELFDQRYDNPEATDFRRMIDCYADGKDERLITQMIRASNTLCSVVDPDAWLNDARDRINAAIDLPMDKSVLGMEYSKIIHRDLNAIFNECKAAADALKAMGNFDPYVQYLRDLWLILKGWLAEFDKRGLDGLARRAEQDEMPKLPRVSSLVEGKDVAKSRVDLVRRAMRTGVWRKNLLFTTDQWKEGLDQTMPHVEVFLDLVAEFGKKYDRAKDEQGTLDFSDLERFTLRCLCVDGDATKPSQIARQYQRIYQHVLVDEYQDINPVQDAILSLVSRECLAHSEKVATNLFCVGDVKQSIYRFRLAEAAQFLKRRSEYLQPQSHGKVIDLQKNFRSRAPLLTAINTTFEKLMTRQAAELDYDASQRLDPGKTFANFANGFIGAPVELHLLPKDLSSAARTDDGEEPLDRSEREAILLGRRILELMGRTGKPAMQISDGDTSRPIRLGDIVILLRSMKFKADQFAAVLRGMDIPVHAESATGYFEATEVNDVLSLLQVLDNQRQDIPLAALLRSPLSGLQNAETNLAKIRLAYQGSPPVPFHLAVQRYADEQQDEVAKFLTGFRAQLEMWRQQIRQQPVAEMLWSLYEQTGYLAYVAGLAGGEQRQANLIELHDRARQFSAFERQGLGRFLRFLEKIKKEIDSGQASIASEADDVVRIMSIHRSKGQEFPVVLLPDLGKTINMQDTQGSILLDRQMGLGLQVVDDVRQIRYPSLASAVVQQQLRQQTLAEELRVLYVAMTRAREHLILAGTCVESMGNRWAQQWAAHKGPIPAETVLSARTPLDWLGPVAAIAPDQIAIMQHAAEEFASQSVQQTIAGEMTATQSAVMHGQPLSPPPAIPAEASAVIDSLGWEYPFAAVADVAATASVTSLVKKNVASSGAPVPSKSLDRQLRQPVFLAGESQVDAAEIGTATHVVLEHFDFSRIGDPHTLEKQIDQLVETRRLTRELANEVDREAIEWFLASDVGQLLGRQALQLKREVPIYYANPSGAPDVMDQQMVRGRIDLLVPRDGGWLIVDYKTDRVIGPALEERAAMYAGQLDIYCKAVRQLTGNAKVKAAVVFLYARAIREME